ncbi:unnamed protein product [Cylicostephanus goldi]|uniref:Uncharacterized protein n=1 Tax=Cylicostephanus goldi TaxID=71465 RepID=A0A3P6T6I1_CYLGO|nr:unnamed protein product [Cylicostephanus goldi]
MDEEVKLYEVTEGVMLYDNQSMTKVRRGRSRREKKNPEPERALRNGQPHPRRLIDRMKFRQLREAWIPRLNTLVHGPCGQRQYVMLNMFNMFRAFIR